MISIPPQGQNAQDQIVAILRTQLLKAQTRIQSLEARQKWEDKLFANPYLSPGHKLTLRATVYTVRKADQSQDGLTKIYIPAIAEKTGLSPKTVGKNLQFLADTGALIREAETQTDENGQRITRVYIGLTDAVKRPDQITPTTPRNHGGLREHCPACGSENLLEEKTIICTDCGTVISKTQKIINQEQPDGQLDYRQEVDELTQPTPYISVLEKQKEPTDNLTAGEIEKPTTPPGQSAACSTNAADIITLQQMNHEQERNTAPATGEAERKAERDLQQAAHLLLDVAGDQAEHIMMNTNPRIEKKYLTVHRPLSIADMKDHLAGKKTLGGRLTHADATTRALCFDADTKDHWSQLETSAQSLIAEGYIPLLEPSPADRGGHLWLIFSERVSASVAYRQVVTIAPQLTDVSEYWPSQGKQKVRLPAGKYVTPTFSAWTHLTDAEGQELAATGAQAAAILLSHLTPADLIPATAADGHEPIEHQERSAQRQPRRLAATTPDEQHRRKYGDHQMWVAWPSEQYLIDRFNAEHSIDDLATPERNGMIDASIIGRPERSASVGVTKDGQRFTDFGAGAKQPDGSQDGGDPFEFYIRSRLRNKKDVLRELGQALNREASRELLRAARAGELPPAWIMDILTDTGRAIYNENAQKNGYPPLAAHNGGGVGGFSTTDTAAKRQALSETNAPYPPPDRPCLRCKVMAWQWTGEKYTCSNPGHPTE